MIGPPGLLIGNYLPSREVEIMAKKKSGKLSEREIARRREQAKAQEHENAHKDLAAKDRPAGHQPPPSAKQFRHQGR